jgi:CRP-like cAMP-binding protein
MSTNRIFKKGETIVREGDKVQTIHLIQSGLVSVFLQRPKQKIELYQLGSFQILGEQALSGSPTHEATAVALSETKTIEIPVEILKGQIGELSQLLKLYVKSINDKLTLTRKDLKSMKMERDNTPCPNDQTAKVFGTVYHVANYKGEKKPNGTVSVRWPDYKQYAQRVFLENPRRLEQAVKILIKLKMASFQMVPNVEDPDGPDEIGFVNFSDLQAIEQFFEFYQFYYFKGGKTELLKVDESAMQLVYLLLQAAEGQAMDRFGAVRFDFPKLVERFRSEYGLNLNSDSFAVVATRGLLVKRQSSDDGNVYVSFDLREWQQTFSNWRFLREIDKWNDKGLVDENEAEEPFVKKQKATGHQCPECNEAVDQKQKFCANCGHKIQAAA